MKRPLLRHALADAYERERQERQGREMPTCDACGVYDRLVSRVVVESVACDLCPTCREDGAVP